MLKCLGDDIFIGQILAYCPGVWSIDLSKLR